MKSAVVLVALLWAACRPDPWEPGALGRGVTSPEHQRLTSGREVYASYCVGCHGENGDGRGPAAVFLDPKPRDFRVGRLKFAAVASGEAPRDEDYIRIVSSGLRGTAMPSFALLTEVERRSVVAYVRSFVAKREAPGAAVAVGGDPWYGREAQGIAAGEKVYHSTAMCWSCHPAYVGADRIATFYKEAGKEPPGLRPNLYVPETKDSEWGTPIRAPDFLTDRVKNGLEVDDLARVISAGVGGTAMPTWAGALDARDIYGLAHYVRSIALNRGTPEGRALVAELLRHPVPEAHDVPQ